MIKTLNDSTEETNHSIIIEKENFVVSIGCDRQEIIVFHRRDAQQEIGIFYCHFDGLRKALELVNTLIDIEGA